MLFCGIDLHSNNSVVVVTDDADKVLYSRRLPNNLTEICDALSPYLKDLFGVVVESTFNWYWLVDGLIEAGHSVHLANTVAIKQYDGLKYRGDESDARHLAHILRLGLLPEGHIMPPPLRAVRDLSRKRMQLVQQRTTQLLSIGTCLAQQTGGQISGDSIKRLTEADIDKMPIGSTEAIGVKANLAVMDALQTQIDGIEKVLMAHCHNSPGYRLLNTVPGIGSTLATVILLETGDVGRFADVGNYASIAAVSAVPTSRTARKKAKATPRTATAIWRGRTSRQPISPSDFASRRASFTSVRRPNGMQSSRPKRSRTNWRVPAF
jgi:transposase